MQDFQNKNVLVTGGGQGIGAAIVRAFVARGAFVMINYITDEDKVFALIQELGEQNCMAVQADVSDPASVQTMCDVIKETRGSLDVLVNNAGIVSSAPLQETTIEKWNKTFSVNVGGQFLCIKHMSPIMNVGGAIVNIASIRGLYEHGRPPIVDYSASKAAVISLTKTMAKELAPHVRVNSVSPGVAATEMIKDYPKDFIEKITQEIYLGALIQPDQIASAVVFLASTDASGITGVNLMVDGGQSLSH